jgi:hypothetical protein
MAAKKRVMKTAGKRGSAAKKAAGKAKSDAFPAGLARKALEGTTRAIRGLQKNVRQNAYKIGKQLEKVDRLELYRAKKYESVIEYANAECDITRGVAYQYMRVADAFNEATCVAFGPEKLDQALRYIARTPAHEEPKDVPEMTVEVPHAGRKGTIRKPFAETTTLELRAATAAQKGQAPRENASPLPPSLVKTLAAADMAVDKIVGRALAGGATLAARAHEKVTLLDISGIPFHLAKPCLKAIVAALG